MEKNTTDLENINAYNSAYFVRFKSMNSDSYLNNYIFPNIVYLLGESGNEKVAVEEVDGKDCMIIFLSEERVQKFIDFCEDEDIIEHHEDISYRLLTQNNLDEVIIKMIHSDEFKDRFDKFFERNTTMDSILDKITINGEDSLSEFEVEFLKQEVARNRTNNLHK